MKIKSKKIIGKAYSGEDLFSGICLGIGCNYEEFENNAGNYSTFIILKEDGTVENYPCDCCYFPKEDENV